MFNPLLLHFNVGIYQVVPVFTACMTSYFLLSGSGLLKSIARRANRSSPKDGEQGFARMSFSFKKLRRAITSSDAFITPEINLSDRENRYDVKVNDLDNDNNENVSIAYADDKVMEIESQECGS